MLLASIASGSAQQTAGVRGVVRNTDGVPQMGVVVELLGGDSQIVANAFTDLNGRFVLRGLAPGHYQLRATAALYLPALRNRLQLQAGTVPTITLMLSSLFEQAWPNRTSSRRDLPDDWRWTLRSSANRPLLRVLDDDDLQVSGGRVETGPARYAARAAVEYRTGGFASSGTVSSVDLQRVAADESSTSFVRLASAQRGNGPGATDVAAGFERHTAQGVVRKTAVHLQSRPGIAVDGKPSELLIGEAQAGERLPLGDFGEVQSGASLRTVRLGQTTAVTSLPFVRVLTPLSHGWELAYGLASDPDCQSIDDIGSARPSPYRFGASNRGLQPERDLHQSISAQHHLGRGTVTATYTHDSRSKVVLTGVPAQASDRPATLAADALPATSVVDPVTGDSLILQPGFSSQGWFLALAYPVGESSRFMLQGGDDVALGPKHLPVQTIPSRRLSPQRAPFIKASAQTTLAHMGTRVRATYTWQPAEVVSVVSPYAQGGDGAFLSIHIKQPLRAGGLFPEGAVFTFDGENILREGYVAVASTEAEAMSLAGTLRTLQAGLAFTF